MNGKRTGFAALFMALLLLVCFGALAAELEIQDHVWDDGEFYQAADCSHGPRYIYHCTVEGCYATQIKEVGSPDPNAHNWGPWTLVKAATCTESGTQTRTCRTNSHHTDQQSIAALGHAWDGGAVTMEPTATKPGEITYTCQRDPSHKKVEVLNALLGAVEQTGTLGENLTWTLFDSGALVISGEGEMIGFSDEWNSDLGRYITTAPWGAAPEQAIIEDGVTLIGYKAFFGCPNLAGVTIPASVDCIDGNAFQYCDALTDVTIEEGVTSIGAAAFADCAAASITIPASVTGIGGGAFSGCENLSLSPDNESFVIEDGVLYDIAKTNILWSSPSREGVFEIPSTVTNIDWLAFINCTRMTGVAIPGSVARIGFAAFSGCSGLTEVTIPEGVEYLDYYAFSGCTGLESVTLPSSLAKIDFSAFSDCTGLTELTIPFGVSEIEEAAFRGCAGLASVTLPSSITFIDETAFDDCSEELTFFVRQDSYALQFAIDHEIPYVVDETPVPVVDSGTLGKDVAWTLDEEGLLTVSGTGPMDDLTEHWNSHFKGLQILRVKIEEGITAIGMNNFRNCRLLQEVSIPDSVESIGHSAFEHCIALESVTIPKGVSSIGSDVFSQCGALAAISVDPANQHFCSIDGVLFDKGAKTLLTYPAAKPDTEYTVPSTVTQIQRSAFIWSDNLCSVTLPGSVKRVGAFAFESCWNLKTVVLPEGLERLESCVFEYDQLDTVTLPATLTSLHPYAFYECATDAFQVAEGNPNYTAVDGVLYTKDGSTLVRYPMRASGQSFTVPDGVTRLGEGAFEGSALQEIQLPDSLAEIGESAFEQCYFLSRIFIPDSVKTLGVTTFMGCENLKVAVLGQSVATLGESCFTGCVGLREIDLPASVNTIGRNAFDGCSNLECVTIWGMETEIDGTAFRNCHEDLTLYGLVGSTAEAFAKEKGYTYVGIGTLLDSADFVLPAGVETIEAEAFAGIGAKCVILPETVKTIGEKAFADCENLVAVYIPRACRSIDIYAFQNSPVTVYGFAGSAAESYAAKLELRFIAVTAVP